MKRTFAEALEHRRSYYSIGSDSPVLDEEVVHIIRTAVKNVPSAFNSQSTRIVLLLGDEHKKLWDIVKNTLKQRISPEAFAKTEAKIDGCFAAGHGTVLYFEDTTVVKKLQDAFPSYSENFPTWSQHTSAMHQLAVWTMLEDAGWGASLQHYNPVSYTHSEPTRQAEISYAVFCLKKKKKKRNKDTTSDNKQNKVR